MCPGPQHQKMFRTLNLKHHVSQPLLLIYEQETVWVNSWDWFMENTKPKLVLSIYYISIIYVQSEGFCFCFAFCWRASYTLSLISAKFLRLFLIYGGSFFIGQIKARFAEVESLGSTSKYKKRTKKSLFTSSTIHVRPIGTKKHDARAKLQSFSYQTYCFFDVPVAIGVVFALTP